MDTGICAECINWRDSRLLGPVYPALIRREHPVPLPAVRENIRRRPDTLLPAMRKKTGGS